MITKSLSNNFGIVSGFCLCHLFIAEFMFYDRCEQVITWSDGLSDSLFHFFIGDVVPISDT